MHRFLLLALTTGCVVQRHIDRDELILDGPIDTVVYDLAAGELHVEVAKSDAAHLERLWSWSGDRPEVEARVDGRTLFISVDCRNRPFSACAVDHILVLPAPAVVTGETGSGDVTVLDAVSADVQTGSGDLRLIGIAGRATADTGSGDVDLEDIGGDVSVATGSGDVFGRRLTANDVWVDTGSGDVDLQLVAVPSSVDIATGSGDVRLELPDGRYDVRTTVGSGDVTIDGIDVSGSAEAQVRIDTGSGDITIRSGP